MIDFYFSPTPNGHKVLILIEELGLPRRLIDVESLPGKHFNPDFLLVSPNNKMPAIVDRDPPGGAAPFAVFESGAILLYLAERHGFLPADPCARSEQVQWLMWQMAGLGPMSGQNGHFRHHALSERGSYAEQRYAREVRRLYAVLDRRLKGRDHIGEAYGVADIACHPWITSHAIQGIDLADFPHIARWLSHVGARPAVQRAYATGPGYRPSARLEDDDHRRRYRQTAEMLRDAYDAMDRA
ncbi:glutathione S-transferase N-terminal domain-containing protein [Sphingomonas sp. CGMCC 1.13654]|uniref:Glutathione S-transferase N-terminal domain-containing protein n=1 Tax=Sphingomonas chungangi TaxID=2683589 RepID=A0A838L7X3_9SPHN|nr:glutathione S-transferase N-terminal domain-containing protein [Sphingomonas chungangi]MBA2934812.1 glutathione S-transferase N-terminal domain-containing protein [Sphingomonas chungangi]MVW58123.1 thiol:disulfide oxidoreductase [Sphingomonas chungangi]